MPLIFAVDSDKRQSAQLASLLRSHVDADLVQSATVLDGIDVLQGRIPDLVLTSSLLSPRDESALANHMRELGARAAHVHTLTIPVLAAARKASKKRPTGVLGALRREKGADVEAAGCEPEVFAKEVEIYLGRAVEERGGTDAGAEPESTEPQYVEPQYVEPQYAEPLDVQPVAVAEPEALDSDAVAPMAIGEVTDQDQGPGALYLDRPETVARDALMAQPPAAVADGFASTALGQSSASNSYATAMGYKSVASGYASIAAGNNSTASGDHATSMGDSDANGFGSTTGVPSTGDTKNEGTKTIDDALATPGRRAMLFVSGAPCCWVMMRS